MSDLDTFVPNGRRGASRYIVYGCARPPQAPAPTTGVTITDDRGVALNATTTSDGVTLTVRNGDVVLTSAHAVEVTTWLRTVPRVLQHAGVTNAAALAHRSHERRDRKDGSTAFRTDRVHLVLSNGRGGVRFKVTDGPTLSAGTCLDLVDVLEDLAGVGR
jgi:hypothetical protein